MRAQEDLILGQATEIAPTQAVGSLAALLKAISHDNDFMQHVNDFGRDREVSSVNQLPAESTPAETTDDVTRNTVGIFGEPLEAVLRSEQNAVPSVVSICCTHIETYGLDLEVKRSHSHTILLTIRDYIEYPVRQLW